MKQLATIAFVLALFSLAVLTNLRSTDTLQQQASVGKGGTASETAEVERYQVQEDPPKQQPAIGYEAPHFSLNSIDHETYRLNGPREKPLILNFWASWCGPCREEAPVLKQLYEKYRDRLDLYAVNLTTDDNLEDAKAFVEKYELPFPILLDTEGKVGRLYLIQGIPTTFFVDRSGVIRNMMLGMPSKELFEQEVKALLDG
ncbi:MAG: TlpA family protein disulfide reductase [Brevibacillus sp.]|nr:TlpA family protein disulfide reductase [Brevibacillus sp.]